MEYSKMVSVTYETLRKRFFEGLIKENEDLIKAIQSNNQITANTKYIQCSDIGMEISFLNDALRGIELLDDVSDES